MLTVEPQFNLDRTFCGLHHVEKSITSINIVIRPVDDPTDEPQKVSKCSQALSSSSPWFGHSGRNRKRLQIHKPKESEDEEMTESQQITTTTCG